MSRPFRVAEGCELPPLQRVLHDLLSWSTDMGPEKLNALRADAAHVVYDELRRTGSATRLVGTRECRDEATGIVKLLSQIAFFLKRRPGAAAPPAPELAVLSLIDMTPEVKAPPETRYENEFALPCADSPIALEQPAEWAAVEPDTHGDLLLSHTPAWATRDVANTPLRAALAAAMKR